MSIVSQEKGLGKAVSEERTACLKGPGGTEPGLPEKSEFGLWRVLGGLELFQSTSWTTAVGLKEMKT